MRPHTTAAQLRQHGRLQRADTALRRLHQPALHQHNSDGTHRDDATTRHELDDITPTQLPWDWVDDLKDFAVIAPIAAALVGVAAMALGALVGWVLKG